MSKPILLAEYGSTAHGTSTEFSDRDYMGIAIEPIESAAGLTVWEGSQEHSAGRDVRSMVGDTDTTIYSLRRWARLAAKGNPTALTPLFVPSYVRIDALGERLVAERSLFITREAGRRFLGYMQSQREAMTGLRNKRTNRPELVHQFGFDTKFAYHMIRLGLLGIEMMKDGTMTLPMRDHKVETLMRIRRGEVDREWVLDYSWQLDDELKTAIDASPLPVTPDREAIDSLLVDLHLKAWLS
jgi:predicted nucleotidyltransferase